MVVQTSELARLLDSPPRRSKHNEILKHSAVMMILMDGKVDSRTQTSVVVIMKTVDGSRHGGQIAFPGGKVEPDDESPLAAALRETEEEIGVPAEQLQLLGSLGYFSTLTTGYDAAVFVARANSPLSYQLQQQEVSAVFEVPLEILYEQFDPNLQLRNLSDFLRLHFHVEANPYLRLHGSDWPTHRDSICIWGFTARVLQHFLHKLRPQSRRLGFVAGPWPWPSGRPHRQ